MAIDWAAVNKALFPIKNYEDLSRRWREAFSVPVIRKAYHFTLPILIDFLHRQLAGDPRQRYTAWESELNAICHEILKVGVSDLCDLVDRVDSEEKFEGFVASSGISAEKMVNLLKYLVYWVLPSKKGLGQLFKNDPRLSGGVEKLRLLGIRSNLDLLEHAVTPADRKKLCDETGAGQDVIDELVNRADFSRMAWTSSATVSNIIGAGYGSIDKLASAPFERVEEDFYRYGESIGKNLKFGNEIDSSHRIVQFLPRILKWE